MECTESANVIKIITLIYWFSLQQYLSHISDSACVVLILCSTTIDVLMHITHTQTHARTHARTHAHTNNFHWDTLSFCYILTKSILTKFQCNKIIFRSRCQMLKLAPISANDNLCFFLRYHTYESTRLC